MIEMLMEQATKVRSEWSATIDSVAGGKPKFIKRTRDRMWFSNLDIISEFLSVYQFTADRFIEDDGSVTLSLREIDLAENGVDEAEARQKLGDSILAYATDYYDNYDLYTHTPNRKGHVPYVFKAIIMDSGKEIGEQILCLDGKN